MRLPTLYTTPEISSVQHDWNLRTIRDFLNALAALFQRQLTPTGNPMAGAWNDANDCVDRLITQAKLAWLWAIYGEADTVDGQTYTVEILPSTGFAYANGLVLFIRFATANTATPCTLNVNSAGAVTLKKEGATDIAVGEIAAGTIAAVLHDGTNFQVIDVVHGVTPVTSTTECFKVRVNGTTTCPFGVTVTYTWELEDFDYGGNAQSGVGLANPFKPTSNGTWLIMASSDYTVGPPGGVYTWTMQQNMACHPLVGPDFAKFGTQYQCGYFHPDNGATPYMTMYTGGVMEVTANYEYYLAAQAYGGGAAATASNTTMWGYKIS